MSKVLKAIQRLKEKRARQKNRAMETPRDAYFRKVDAIDPEVMEKLKTIWDAVAPAPDEPVDDESEWSDVRQRLWEVATERWERIECSNCEGEGRVMVWGYYADEVPASRRDKYPLDFPDESCLKEEARPGVKYVCPCCYGAGEQTYMPHYHKHHLHEQNRRAFYENIYAKTSGYPYWLSEFHEKAQEYARQEEDRTSGEDGS